MSRKERRAAAEAERQELFNELMKQRPKTIVLRLNQLMKDNPQKAETYRQVGLRCVLAGRIKYVPGTDYKLMSKPLNERRTPSSVEESEGVHKPKKHKRRTTNGIQKRRQQAAD